MEGTADEPRMLLREKDWHRAEDFEGCLNKVWGSSKFISL